MQIAASYRNLKLHLNIQESLHSELDCEPLQPLGGRLEMVVTAYGAFGTQTSHLCPP
jgi:hypothetical protein